MFLTFLVNIYVLHKLEPFISTLVFSLWGEVILASSIYVTRFLSRNSPSMSNFTRQFFGLIVLESIAVSFDLIKLFRFEGYSAFGALLIFEYVAAYGVISIVHLVAKRLKSNF